MAATIKIVISSTESGGGIDDTKKSLKELDDTAAKSGGGFSIMKGLAVEAIGAIANAAMSAAGAVAGFVKDSISAAGDFEAGMNTFAAASGVSGKELEGFKDQFIDLGKELPVSTTAVQDAATAMVKGGIDPAIVRAGALKDTLQFSLATGFDTLEEAAETSAKMLGTFGDTAAPAADQAAELAHMQELVAKSANASTLDADKLTQAMLMSGGSAKAAGVDFDEFVTTMGATASAFPSAATQGTSMNNFFTRLIPQTTAAKDAMGKLGLWTEETGSLFYDAQGNFIGMEEAAGLMDSAFSGLTEAQRSEAMATIFGNDAKNAALAIMELGTDGYNKFAETMANANGIQEQSAATQQGFNFQMENMKGSIEALQIILGTALLPTLTMFLGKITEGINGLMAFAEAALSSGDPLGFVAQKIGEMISSVAATLPGQLQAWAEQLGAWVLNALPGLGANLALFAQSIFTWIGSVLPPLVAQLATWINGFVQWVIIAAPLMLTQLGIYAASMLGFLQANLPAIVQQLGLWAAQFLAWLVDTIPKILLAGGDLVASLINFLIESTPGFVENLAKWGEAFLNWLVETTPKVMAEAGKLWDKLKTWLGETAGAVIPLAQSVGKSIIEGLAKGISNAASIVKEAAIAAAKSALDAAKNFLGIKSPSAVFADGVGTPISEGIAQGIVSAGGSIQQALNGVLGSAMGGAQAAVGIRASAQSGDISGALGDLALKLGSGNKSVTNNYHYSPTYGSAPQKPSSDFNLMKALANAGV